MDFFKNNPEIVGKVMRVILEYLGFIEPEGLPDEGDPAYRYAHAILENVGRGGLVVLVIAGEITLAQITDGLF